MVWCDRTRRARKLNWAYRAHRERESRKGRDIWGKISVAGVRFGRRKKERERERERGWKVNWFGDGVLLVMV